MFFFDHMKSCFKWISHVNQCISDASIDIGQVYDKKSCSMNLSLHFKAEKKSFIIQNNPIYRDIFQRTSKFKYLSFGDNEILNFTQTA